LTFTPAPPTGEGVAREGAGERLDVSRDDDFPDLLERARHGESEALTAIYRDLSPLVLGYARGLGTPEPEDVASEAFVSVVKGLPRFTGDERQFRSWVLTITHRRATDELRRQGRRPQEVGTLDEYGTLVFDRTRSDEQALSSLRIQGVLDAIDQLTEDQRAVLLLRTLADLPVREVAEIVGKEESAVKALQRRAVAAVRRRLGEVEP
jgi:RNA polymerase sigma-70 factor (ECF subfamily)